SLFFAMITLFCGRPMHAAEDCCYAVSSIELYDVLGYALENQWDINIAQEEVRRQYGISQRDSGPFDPVFDTSIAYTWQHQVQDLAIKTNKDGNIVTQQASLNKLARVGTTYSLNATVERELNPIFAFTDPFRRTNTFNLAFVIDQPLLRRFRDNIEATQEKVSVLELQAIKWEAIHTISTQIRIAVNSYWELVATKGLLKIRQDSLQRLDNLADSTERLVERGQLAKSELNQQYAEVSKEKRRSADAEQQVYAAFNNLLLSMGANQCDFTLSSPDLALEEFPITSNNKSILSVNRLVDEATHQRLDLLAAQIRINSADLLLRSANNTVLPEMNVRLGTNVINHEINRKAKPFYSSVISERPEVELFAALDFSIPFYNDEALGERRRRRAEKYQSFLGEAELMASIRSDVATALRDHYALFEQIQAADESVKWYEKALRDEVDRMKEGLSTLFIVIDFENRLSDALTDRVLVYRNFAQNIVDLLFLTGKLIIPCENSDRVMIANVRSLEALNER
nr:hypothetical protein [Chlamydiota bacterium]